MKSTAWFPWVVSAAWLMLLCVPPAYAVREADLKRLTAAGIDGATLAVIVEEKVIETVAFTVDELIALKQQARLSNETIRFLVKERSFLKDRESIVYGKEVQPIRLSTVADIIRLKQAGMSDEIIQAIIQVCSASSEVQDRERAWRVLEHVGIVIDGRKAPAHP